MKRTPRIKPALLIASAAAATLLVGTLGGATMALWHAEQSFTSQIQTGKVAFAVGAPGSTLTQNATSTGDKLSFAFGKAEAETLVRNKQIAIPIQVDSLSQGNKGLHYTVEKKIAENSIFEAANAKLVRVASAAACTMNPAALDHENFKRTPVPATYSADSVPTSEFWCLTASLDALPGAGTYTNTATVTATTATGTGPVTDSDDWWANVTSLSNPSTEPTHKIDFTFETFRPGK